MPKKKPTANLTEVQLHAAKVRAVADGPVREASPSEAMDLIAKQMNQAGQQVIVNGDMNPNEVGTQNAP